jgi:hypothetical protein
MGELRKRGQPFIGSRDASLAEAFPELEGALIEYYESDLSSDGSGYTLPQGEPAALQESGEVLRVRRKAYLASYFLG